MTGGAPSGIASDAAVGLRSLSLGYAAAVDALDGPGFADLFTPEGELWVPDPRTGGDPTICRAGRDRLERIPSGLAGYHATRHAVWATAYDVEGDTATGVVDGVAHHLGDDPDPDAGGGPVDLVWYLRYVDEYVRTAGGWRFTRRALHLDHVERRPLRRLGPGRP